jgi:drug/metabolite transporter (DMT)-like permease
MTRSGELRDILLLLSLGTAWGGSFFMIKIAVTTVPPLTVAASRLVIAAACLSAIAALQGHPLPRTLRLWGVFLIVGLLGNALPFVLIGYGEVHIDSGVAAILMAVVPLATMVLAHFFVAGEVMSVVRFAGIALGLVGVAALVGIDALRGLGTHLLGQAAVLGAAFSYALVNIIASRFRHLPPTANAASAMIGASLWTVPLSLAVDRPWTLAPSADSLLAILGLALISTTIGAMVFFHLLHAAGPSFAALCNYIVPLMGVFWGWLILAEYLGWNALAALVLILAGIALVRMSGRVGARAAAGPP